ncbi:MAG: hypothetical protein E7580_08310 [Ruminococcaceae bacterium]|nr:hypothetical protein [Oscillospiraceae bacterium]
MRKRLAGILSGLLAAVFILSLFPVSAVSYEGAPEVGSTAAVVYNLGAEEALYTKNLDGRLDPATFTKLMTALLAFEYRAKNGNVTVTVTEEMLSAAGGTSMRLKVGEVIPFDSLLAGLVVQNANDAALVIASTVGGNIMSFVEQMNAKAKQLGMNNTYYANPTGVDSAAMFTTMRDILTLCKALYRVNDFMLLAENPKISIPATNLSIQRAYTNKNALVPYSYVTDYYMEGVRGMIAGYTPRAGYCVATVREHNGNKNLVIVSGGVDRSEQKNGTDISSYREAKALMEWAEANFGIRRVMEQGTVATEQKVRLASGVDHMILVTGEGLEKLLPLNADLAKDVTSKVRVEQEVFTAPIIEGTTYGNLDVYYRGELIGTLPLVAKSNIGLSRWLVAWDAVESFFSQGPARVILIMVICAVVFYIISLIVVVIVQYNRRNREKKQAIKEMMQIEDQRLKKVRQEERKANQARMRKMRSALRAGFRVLQGESEADPQVQSGKKKPAPSKAVAKVPEKYRNSNRAVQPAANASRRPAGAQTSARRSERPSAKNGAPQRKPEVYRTGRPSRPSSQSTVGSSRPAGKAPQNSGAVRPNGRAAQKNNARPAVRAPQNKNAPRPVRRDPRNGPTTGKK